MSIEDAIVARMTGYAGLAALVSSRIYAVQAPQNPTLPYIVFERVSSSKISLMSADTGVSEARFQFTCYGSTYTSARNVVEQVRQCWQRYSGTVSSVVILDTEIETDQDEFDPDTKEYYSIMDIMITHRE